MTHSVQPKKKDYACLQSTQGQDTLWRGWAWAWWASSLSLVELHGSAFLPSEQYRQSCCYP